MPNLSRPSPTRRRRPRLRPLERNRHYARFRRFFSSSTLYFHHFRFIPAPSPFLAFPPCTEQIDRDLCIVHAGATPCALVHNRTRYRCQLPRPPPTLTLPPRASSPLPLPVRPRQWRWRRARSVPALQVPVPTRLPRVPDRVRIPLRLSPDRAFPPPPPAAR